MYYDLRSLLCVIRIALLWIVHYSIRLFLLILLIAYDLRIMGWSLIRFVSCPNSDTLRAWS